MMHLHVLIFRARNDEQERSEHDVALATNVLESSGICQGSARTAGGYAIGSTILPESYLDTCEWLQPTPASGVAEVRNTASLWIAMCDAME